MVALIAAISFRMVPSFNRILIAIQHLKFYLPLANSLHEDLLLSEELNFNKNEIKIDFKNKIELKNLFLLSK